MPVKSLGSVVLPQKAAAIRYCNDESGCFIVSTYQLDDETSLRKGGFYWVNDFTILKTLSMSGGVFRFEHLSDGHLIAALTNGCLSIVDPKTSCVSDVTVETDRILLSVSVRGDSVVTSDDHGSLHIVNLISGMVESFQAHTLPFTGEVCEVWNAIWLGEHCLVSGGEDAILKMWDSRNRDRAIAISKAHSSGIVCLKKEDDMHLLSGSYDEYIRRFDIRSLKDPIDEKNLGGGVWAIENVVADELLVSCMYNGWCLLDGKNFSELESNHDLGSQLLYGASFCPVSRIVASSTFNNYTVNFDQLVAT